MEIDGKYPPFSNLGLVIQPLRNWTQGLFHLGHFLHDFHHLLMGNEEIEICKKNKNMVFFRGRYGGSKENDVLFFSFLLKMLVQFFSVIFVNSQFG